ncbi:MAG: MFS transporter [Isosphaeraceae bacterium]|jgi:MFS family permease|nr:MAG: MFS transporter [Isosphaeraceae bacterium]
MTTPAPGTIARGSAAPSPPSPLVRGALFALVVLFSMNLVNYVDRYVFAAVGPAITRDLKLSKAQFGTLSASFMVVYTLVSPIMGWLGDRQDRRRLLAFGVGLWSLATVATAFAATFNQMFLARAFLGIGEASYGVVAPTLLADFFAPDRRGKVMGIFYLALPVGTAVGYGVGGLMEGLATDHADAIRSTATALGLGAIAEQFVGWRAAFWVVGLPGLILAALGLMMRDPPRGASDTRLEPADTPQADIQATTASGDDAAQAVTAVRGSDPTARPQSGLAGYLSLLRTPSYLLNTAGMAAVTFTTGAFGNWFPTYFEQVHRTAPRDKVWLGLALAGAGLVGVLIGMWLPEWWRRRNRRAYLLWAALAVLCAVPIGALGLLAPDTYVSLGLLTVASVLMASCLGPCNTVTANVVPGPQRAVGYAVSIFLLHLFGDIPSPPLIGWFADRLGTEAGRASPLGRFFEGLGALPVSDGHHLANITAGMLLIVPVLLIGSLCFLLGSKFLPRDEDRAQAYGTCSSDLPLH